MSKMKDKAIDEHNNKTEVALLWKEVAKLVSKKTYNLITKIVNLEIEIEKDCNL